MHYLNKMCYITNNQFVPQENLRKGASGGSIKSLHIMRKFFLSPLYRFFTQRVEKQKNSLHYIYDVSGSRYSTTPVVTGFFYFLFLIISLICYNINIADFY